MLEREQEWELARKLELERKMAKQKERGREEEEERRQKERERLIAMEREREEFRIRTIEKEMEKERERQRIMELELEREREMARAAEQERLAQIPAPLEMEGSSQDVPSWSTHGRASDNEYTLPTDNHSGQRATKTNSRVPDIADDHLPTSPAPPPYKSPSPDSEHARLSHRANVASKATPHPPPPARFAFHPSILGVMPDYGTTDFGGDRPAELGVPRSGAKMNLRSPRFHSRSPRLRSPQPNPQPTHDPGVGGTRDSLSPGPDLHHPSRKSMDKVATSCDSQFLPPRSKSDAARYVKPHSNSTDGWNKEGDERMVSQDKPSLREQASGTPPSRVKSSNMFEELDQLLGGVNAMITEVEMAGTTPIPGSAPPIPGSVPPIPGSAPPISGSVPSFPGSAPPIPGPTRANREDREGTDEAVILPPAEFNGEEATVGTNQLGSAPSNQPGTAPGNGSVPGGNQPGAAPGNQLENDLSQSNEGGSSSYSDEESDQWLEGSPIVEQRRVAMADLAKQNTPVKPSQSAHDGRMDTMDHMTQEREWQDGGERNGEEERAGSDSGSVVIRPPSPYAGGTGKGAGLEETDHDLQPPPIPPLPAPHLLDELGGGAGEESGMRLEDVPSFPDEDMDQIHVRPHCIAHTYTQDMHTHTH